MKIAIFLIGPGASGKTTVRKAFAQGEAQTIRTGFILNDKKGVDRKSDFYVTTYANCACAGTDGSGTDANDSPESIRLAFMKCFETNEVVIVDGVMGSPKWALMCNPIDDLHVICIYFKLEEEVVYQRLLGRRRDKGKIEECLPEKTKYNCRIFMARADGTLKHFESKCTKPLKIVRVDASHSPQEIVKEIYKAIGELHSENAHR